MIFDYFIDNLKTIPLVCGQVYHAEALKNAKAPFIFWLQNRHSFTQALDGFTGLCSASFEVSVVAANLDDLETIADAVVDLALNATGARSGQVVYEAVDIVGSSPTLDERAVGMYRKTYIFQIDYQIMEE